MSVTKRRIGGNALGVVEKRPQFREEAQLGHGERPELDLETDKTRYGGSNNSGNSARALVSRGRVRDAAEDAE